MERTTAAAARPVAGHGPIPGHVEDAAGRAALLLCALGLGVAGAIGSTTVAVAAIPKIHACPQPDGSPRFQDRPCNAAHVSSAPPAPVAPQRAVPSRAVGTRDAPAARPPASRSPPPDAFPPPDEWPAPATPASRAEYLALNAERCRQGHSRACAAVTCERSGNLASRECQAAVGFHAGRGWQARPRGDVFAPGPAVDDYVLRCTASGRTHRFGLLREGATPVATGGGAPQVERASLAAFAARTCGATAGPAGGDLASRG